MGIGVTGSSGFLGKALVEALGKSSLNVAPISLPRTSEALQSDYLENLAGELEVQAVFHLAAVRKPGNHHEFEVNARLPSKLAKAFEKMNPKVQFFHLSSLNAVLSERRDAYSRSKRQAETLLENSNVTLIRPGIIWSWSSNSGGDAKRLRKYLELPLPFHPIPFPGQLYRPILVEDLVDRMVNLLEENPLPGTIDVQGDQDTTIWELAKCIAKETRSRLVPVPTFFWEKLLPNRLLKHFPVALRSSDASKPDKNMGKVADEVWEFPFHLSSKKNDWTR